MPFKLLILLDNLTSHKVKLVKAVAAKYSNILVFNLPYYCKGNPIEYFFNSTKKNLKEVDYDHRDALVLKAIDSMYTIKSSTMEGFFRLSFKRILETLESC